MQLDGYYGPVPRRLVVLEAEKSEHEKQRSTGRKSTDVSWVT